MQKITRIVNKYSYLILGLAILLYIITIYSICLWKYWHFQYNALDLAIFNQVFYQTSQGNLFGFTIHPHSYLGDHLGLFLIFLTPFYWIVKSPPTLLLLQTIFLALGAWPIYLIARLKLSKNISLLLALIFLVHPFIQNINLFEFHLLPLAIFTLLFASYFYFKKQFSWFIVFSLLSLTIREDVALVIFMFGLLAIIDKRSWKWIVYPLLISVLWFFAALRITTYFSQYENYKFLTYYLWLGDSPLEIFQNFFLKPGLVAKQLFSLGNIAFVVAALLNFCLLPLLKPKYLLPALLVFCQILLSSFGGGELTYKTHYITLMVPFLFIASIFSLALILNKKGRINRCQKHFVRLIAHNKPIFLILGIVTMVYSVITVGPFFLGINEIISFDQDKESIVLKKWFTESVPQDASIVASYDYLSNLSSRSQLYSLHYVFMGTKQYSEEQYVLPENAEYMLVDSADFLEYQVQFNYQANIYQDGDDNIRNIIRERNFGIQSIADDQILLQKDTEDKYVLYEIIDQQENLNIQYPIKQNLGNQIEFLGHDTLPTVNCQLSIVNCQLLPVSFYWQAISEIEKNYQLQLTWFDKNNNAVYQKIYTVASGIYPTSEWSSQEVVKTNYWFKIPSELASGNYNLKINLVDLEGRLGLNNLRSTMIKYKKINPIGGQIDLD